MVLPFKFKREKWRGFGIEFFLTRYPIVYNRVVGGGYRYVRVFRLMFGPWEWHWYSEEECAV